MTKIQKQSERENLYMVLIGEQVAVCDLTKPQADALVAAVNRAQHTQGRAP